MGKPTIASLDDRLQEAERQVYQLRRENENLRSDIEYLTNTIEIAYVALRDTLRIQWQMANRMERPEMAKAIATIGRTIAPYIDQQPH